MQALRRFTAAIVCCLLIWIPVFALSAATGVNGKAVVEEDGSCQVELTVTIRLESARDDLTFPLDASAADILLNGHPAPTAKQEGKLHVSLPPMTAGQQSFVFSYKLPQVIEKTKEGTFLELALLSGFGLTVERLDFTLTLPGPITGRPTFHSGYYQENIRLSTQILENTLVGNTMASLKDHETLSLQLQVDPDQFHIPRQRLLTGWDWATLVLFVLAGLFFGLTMLPKFSRLERSFTAPEGVTAGDVGCCLTGSGTDLGMMVLSWAQLGYLQLELDRRGRVLLHKGMDMGNERSGHEMRIFQAMFARRSIVDATARNYARLYRKVARNSPMRRQLYAEMAGDGRIFLGLCCLAGMCGMIQLTQGRLLWSILLAPVALILSFGIHTGCKYLPLRNKVPILVSLGCILLWILLGKLFGGTGRALWMVLLQLAAGILAAFGGKRSMVGIRNQAQLLGLGYHMLTTEPYEMQQLQEKNPDYFYEMLPYAIALGVDRQFARRFGNRSLPECLWLKNAPHMNPQQCAAKMRQIANILDRARYAKV